ncbi:Hypothetical protein R9X50_00738000 [Acrodontium crateriforme]|uniref:Bulb-type lectin domain-containing protein n=1 Tax=Acrodontium crateriforme TaxID=150365 RepID=A0AAQ3MA35_9PEZI|nr:Hypothetical protein R9X50_00738000 [Acrodontium crateriforme]
MEFMISIAAACATTSIIFAPPAHAAVARSYKTATPIIQGQDFPDPGLIRTDNGWHAFATTSRVKGKDIHVQMASSPDFKQWTYHSGQDPLTNLPSWVDAANPQVWAPEVSRLDDGSFIMYYTAALKSNPRLHCVSFATSKDVNGPYVDSTTQPWTCDVRTGGTIDPSGYKDADGTRWVVYKIDGNALGHGGACMNSVHPIVSTPIMLQQVSAADGHTKIGEPIKLLTNGPHDGPVVEAPVLTKLGSKYVLFFSSNCFATPLYDSSYAIATDIKGPYTKYGPLFVTGDLGLTAPGGLSIATNGNHAIWHGDYKGSRAAYTALLALDGNRVTVSNVS